MDYYYYYYYFFLSCKWRLVEGKMVTSQAHKWQSGALISQGE